MPILTVSGFHGTINVGDSISGPGLPDRRSRWQKFAPKWLGGKSKPGRLECIVVAQLTGTPCGSGTYEVIAVERNSNV
jgi:hypothetical protein